MVLDELGHSIHLPTIETSRTGAGAPAGMRVVLEEVRHQAMNQRAGLLASGAAVRTCARLNAAAMARTVASARATAGSISTPDN